MSNLSEIYNAVTAESVDAIGAAGGLLGVVAQVAGAISGGISIAQWFQTLGQPADATVQGRLDKLQATVEAARQGADTGVAALGFQENFQAVDSVMDDAKAQFGLLATIDPKDETSVNTAIGLCYKAVISLRDDIGSKWTVPWAEGVLGYSDNWSGNLYPPHTGSVFNYSYALPQFLRSISLFLAVAGALKPSTLVTYTADLRLCVSQLQTIQDMIWNSGQTGVPGTLVGTKVPLPGDVASYDMAAGQQGLQTSWTNASAVFPQKIAGGDPSLWPFVAVEEYSGASVVDSYWPFLPYLIELYTPNPVITDSFVRLVTLRIENRKKKLYGQIGLPPVLQTMNQLRAITGDPIPTDPPYNTWSFRNALSILGVSLKGMGAFRSLNAFLKTIPPYSGGYLYGGGATYPPSPTPTSFRSLFAPP